MSSGTQWDTEAVRSGSWSGRGWISLFLHKLAEEERGGGSGMGQQGAHRVSGACPALCRLRGGCPSASCMVSRVQMTSFLRTVSPYRIFSLASGVLNKNEVNFSVEGV